MPKSTPRQNVYACVNLGHFRFPCCLGSAVQVNFVVRITLFKLVVANQQPQIKERPHIQKRYVDNNLNIGIMFVGPFTKCSAVHGIIY